MYVCIYVCKYVMSCGSMGPLKKQKQMAFNVMRNNYACLTMTSQYVCFAKRRITYQTGLMLSFLTLFVVACRWQNGNLGQTGLRRCAVQSSRCSHGCPIQPTAPFYMTSTLTSGTSRASFLWSSLLFSG